MLDEPESETRATRVSGSLPTLESSAPGGSEPPSLPPGTLVGRYVIEERIGAGGMGVVFRARDPALDRVVALKCLRPEFVAMHGERRLVREARGMAQLSHPNVVAVFGVERQLGGIVLAMEHVQGTTLREWLAAAARPWPEVVAYMREAGQGLAAAHAAGLVHRDFKPANVLVGDDGRVRVMDFGLVRADRGRESSLHGDDSLASQRFEGTARASSSDVLAIDPSWAGEDDRTQAGLVMGTPSYMAPEQLCGEEADARCDQFAFCVSLWEALCGRRPYSNDPEQGTREKLLGPPAWPSKVVVPHRLVELVRRGLAPEPAARWPSMDALLAALEREEPRRARLALVRWAAGAAVVTGGVVGLGLWASPERSTACTGAQERLVDVWDTTRSEAVRSRLEAAGAVALEETWPRVQERLDAYATSWAATHVEACEATTVRAEVGPEVLDERMACLERARVELRSLVRLLADPRAELESRAVTLVAKLPPPARCLEAPAADDELPQPDDPALAAEAAALREALTEVKALQLARAHDEALAKVAPLIERARAAGLPALEGVALFRRAMVEQARGEHARAEADLLEAHALALDGAYPRLVQQAASQLAFLIGHRLARPEEGLRWANAGVAEAQRAAPGSVLEADARSSLAVVLHMQGRYDEAVTEQRRALELWRHAAEIDDHAGELDVASATEALGNLVMEQGKAEEAIELHERALAIRERALGPTHLDVASSLNNLGSALMAGDRLDDAVAPLQRALAIRERVLGPDDPILVSVLVNLGGLLSDRERPREAEPYLQRALTIARARLGEDHPYVGSALVNLGGVYRALGDRPAARRAFDRCLATWERTLGPEHPKVALALASLAELDRDEGRLDQAEPRYERSLAIRRAALGNDHPLVARSRVELGRLRLAQQRPADALAEGQAALDVLAQRQAPEPLLAADASALVGRALLALDRRDEARRALDEATRLRPALAEELRAELETARGPASRATDGARP